AAAPQGSRRAAQGRTRVPLYGEREPRTADRRADRRSGRAARVGSAGAGDFRLRRFRRRRRSRAARSVGIHREGATGGAIVPESEMPVALPWLTFAAAWLLLGL